MDSVKPLTIEPAAFRKFLDDFCSGVFGGQRLGQAFYDHFKLHKIANQDKLRNIYEKDWTDAMKVIHEITDFV